MNALKPCKYGLMAFNTNDQYIGRSFAEYGEFSDGEAAIFKALIKPGDVVMDIGANIGAHTLVMAQLAGNEGNVLAFEPQRLVYYTLCANINLNNITNTICLQQAVGSESGRIDVPEFDFTRPNNFGGLELGKEIIANDIKKYSVKLSTIDSFALPRLDFIKIDVEGMEPKVIQGARDTIQRLKPTLYVENDRGPQMAQLIKMIRSFGYHIFAHTPPMFNPDNFMGNKNNVFGNIVSVNMLCVHSSYMPTERGRQLSFSPLNHDEVLPFDPKKYSLTYLPPDKQMMIMTSNAGNVTENIEQETVAAIKRAANVYSNILYKHDKALSVLDMGLELYPDEMILNELAYTILCKEMHYFDAIEYVDRILKKNPDNISCLYNKAVMLGGIRKFDEAIELYRKAVQLDPSLPGPHFNLAISLLMTGQFEEGWKEYQWRFKLPKITQVLDLLPKAPMWDGSCLNGKRVLVFNEQGAGDMIMMSRYLGDFHSLYPDSHITLACSKATIRLMKHVLNNNNNWMKKPIDEFVQFNADDGEPVTGNFDYICSMMDLPMRFCNEKRHTHYFNDVLSNHSFPANTLNVGICWAGNESHENDQDRSVFLKEFEKLKMPGVTFVNLQKGGGKRVWPNLGMIDLAEGADMPMTDLMPLVNDFYDLAGLMRGLDLVITVDTAVAHLAGSMHLPTWMVVGSYPDWRWMTSSSAGCRGQSPAPWLTGWREREETSAWYPNMTLFRQYSLEKDWGNVFDRIQKKLTVEMLQKQKPTDDPSVGFFPGKLSSISRRSEQPTGWRQTGTYHRSTPPC